MFLVAHLDAAAPHEQAHAVLEVVHVGAEEHGTPLCRRFEVILAAALRERAADEHDLAQAVGARELADGVEHGHARFTLRRGVDGGAAQAGLESHGLGDGGDPGGAVGVARRDGQPQVRVVRQKRLVDLDDPGLFALVGRTGDEDRRRLGEIERLEQGRVVGRVTRRCRQEGVELGVAGDDDALRRRAQKTRPFGLFLLAHQKEIDVVERLAREFEQASVLRQALGGEAAVGDGDPRAVGFGRADQVGPDLRVFEHQKVGADGVDGAPRGRGQIPGQEGEGVDALHARGRDFLARIGDRRDDDHALGETLAQMRHHRCQREQIARRGAVQPDARTALGKGAAAIDAEAREKSGPRLFAEQPERHPQKDDESDGE